ncbi:MAG: bifunctional phosphopantothenoylcysteine decarboxylase/phosphopantothenate synthase [Pseudomonadota bacterium]
MSTAPQQVLGPKVLLVVGGGIAAYKSCELVRLIRKGGGDVTCVVTKGGQQFVTPMSLAALSENQVYTTLWDLKNEAEMGHIQLSREADLIVVCPATADLMAKMAAGIADDLATTLLLATDKPVMAVPAMNVRMWEHESTQRNIEELKEAGVEVLHPDEGPMACGEFGYGRLPEPHQIWRAIAGHFGIDVPEEEYAPAPMPANDQSGLSVVEALEPDDEGAAAASSGGLGGLLSKIIPRSTAKRTHEDIDAEYQDLEMPEGFDPDMPIEEEDFEFNPDLGGPLLAKKGDAGAAPPIDPDAINHEVNERQSAPEILPEDMEIEGFPKEDAEEPGEDIEDDVSEDCEAEEPEAEVEAEPEPEAQPEPAPKKRPKRGGAKVEAKAVETEEGDAFDADEFDGVDDKALAGKHVLVTAGPTWEAIDPVRYIANRSSGKQGFAIAAAAAALGARVTLVAGPVALKTPDGVDRIDVESAAEMNQAVRQALPADAAVMVAAVSDWRPRQYVAEKIKKRGSAPPALMLTENPDILANLAGSDKRPDLVVGFAAETDDVIDNAKKKRKRKTADWIIANDVSGEVMGGDDNEVHIISADGVESLDSMAKQKVAMALAERIAETLTAEAAE